MKKKRIAVAVLASCITLSATLGGCSLVTKNSSADMAQEIATVDIRKSDAFEGSGLENYKDAITPSSIVKRDLVSYFINVGSTYVTNYGYSYEDTFNMLLDSLIDNAVLTQYATLYLIGEKGNGALETYKTKSTDVEKYEYLLDEENIKLAKYNLYSSLNSAIDSYEKTIIDEEDEYKGTGTRTTPTNLETEQDDYYPKDKDGNLDYKIYTGYEKYLLGDSGRYQDDAIDGTTRTTRIKAYNTFINNLRSNDLIEDGEEDVLTDVLSLSYIQKEYVSQLESRIVNKYYERYEEQQEELLTKDGYAYVKSVYEELLDEQQKSYKTSSAFESAMGSMSSTSFILYSPDTSDSDAINDNVKNGKFGFVYNILLPFNAKQSAQLTELGKIKDTEDGENYYYRERNNLLKAITTEDQRTAWFNGETDYSFNAKAEDSKYKKGYFGDKDGRNYLFFEGNLTDSEDGGRYKKLQAYDGRYSYNGKVYENDNGSYTLIGNELNIDGMLEEFSAYINYVLSDGLGGDYVSYNINKDYYNETDFHKSDDKKEIDYTKFLYAEGNVDFGGFNKSDLLNTETKQYAAMSAVNELQFAYTTDTSVLSQYIGYSVSAYDTSYIKEFEYAAKLAVSRGEGHFTVCAGDYGWHLIYVTYAFDVNGGNVYDATWDKAHIEAEGTFENLFYEWIKGNDLSDITSSRRSKIISDFSKETGDNVTVIKYQSRYQNLLDVDK